MSANNAVTVLRSPSGARSSSSSQFAAGASALSLKCGVTAESRVPLRNHRKSALLSGFSAPHFGTASCYGSLPKHQSGGPYVAQFVEQALASFRSAVSKPSVNQL